MSCFTYQCLEYEKLGGILGDPKKTMFKISGLKTAVISEQDVIMFQKIFCLLCQSSEMMTLISENQSENCIILVKQV